MHSTALLTAFIALTATGACSPPNMRPAPPPTRPAVPAPAKAMVMICKNSQTGLKVECGTSNAVMVGMKEK